MTYGDVWHGGDSSLLDFSVYIPRGTHTLQVYAAE